MNINNATLKLIKEFEGCYLTAYKDCVGVWTIGYGITNSDKSITGTTIRRGLKISKDTAEKWLIQSLKKKYAPKVLKYQSKYNFNENQFGALLSFCFNVGSIDGLTANGTRSIAIIRKKMLEYCKAGGKVLKGLQRRRKAELALFNKEPTNTPTTSTTTVKKGYQGVVPALPPRGYYKVGDGIDILKDYPTQIKRVQDALNWALNGVKGFTTLKVDKKYGKLTGKAVELYQTTYGLDVNGCWGEKCNKKLLEIKKQ